MDVIVSVLDTIACDHRATPPAARGLQVIVVVDALAVDMRGTSPPFAEAS